MAQQIIVDVPPMIVLLPDHLNQLTIENKRLSEENKTVLNKNKILMATNKIVFKLFNECRELLTKFQQSCNCDRNPALLLLIDQFGAYTAKTFERHSKRMANGIYLTNDSIETNLNQQINYVSVGIQTDPNDYRESVEAVNGSKEESEQTNTSHPNIYICSKTDCKISFGSIKEQVIHESQTHGIEKPFKCVICGHCFESKQSIRNHSLNAHSIRWKDFMCSHCEKRLTTAYRLIQHFNRTHSMNPTIYKCHLCPFETKFDLNNHLRSHSRNNEELKNFVCHYSECQKKFHFKANLTQHIKRVHTSTEYNIKCDFKDCHKMFRNRSSMSSHKRFSHSPKIYKCDWPGCDYTFTTNTLCEYHKRVHLSERSYKCTFNACSKTFKHFQTRNNHLQTHLKKHVCSWPECDQRFADRQALVAHMNRHQNLRPFKCYIDDCERDFFIKKQLDQHIRSFHKTKPNHKK